MTRSTTDRWLIACATLSLIAMGMVFALVQTRRPIAWSDRYTVVGVHDAESLVGRPRQWLTLTQHGDEDGETVTREVRHEIVAGAADHLGKGVELTEAELRDLRGRSHLGTAWNWLRKPREQR